jgi:hypothetical protein
LSASGITCTLLKDYFSELVPSSSRCIGGFYAQIFVVVIPFSIGTLWSTLRYQSQTQNIYACIEFLIGENDMKSIFLTAAACLFLSGPAVAMTGSECATMWKQADANSDGVLNGAEADRYMAMMRVANKTMIADGTMTETIFQENCKMDIFKAASVDEGAPLEGANSFTEAQAKDRVMANGMAIPGAMTKDDQGIWRGTAMKDGKSVNVAVDYKGNVVAQ